MVFKIFLDANVLLDFLLKRTNYNNAKNVIDLVVKGKVKAFITPSIVHIVGYWLSKSYGNKAAKELLLTLLMDVNIIEIDHEITLLALHSKIDDIEDALQYYTALHYQLDFFISEDKTFQKSAIPTLPVVSTEYFLQHVN